MSKLILLISLLIASSQLTHAQAAKPAPEPTPADLHAKVEQSLVDASIADDAAVDKMLEAYAPKVRALNDVIGKLEGDLRKGGVGAGSIGNFVTDGLRAEASHKLGKPVALAITNAGGLRKSSIPSGDIRARDVFELLPFENSLVVFEMTGAQVLELLRRVVDRRDAQSGARIKYRLNAAKRPEMETARLLSNGVETEIDPAALYTIVSIDYLLNVSGGDYSTLLQQAKTRQPLGLTMRDAMTHYVKAETAAGRKIRAAFDGRFKFERDANGTSEEAPQ